jgi:CheY-like chemotaxis protein
MSNQYDWKNKTILIVEDDEASFLYISVLFKNQGANVIRSEDGLDGFFHCMMQEPDIVLMDIRLPVLNGLETIRLIKKYQSQIPIIALSAGVMLEEQNNCLKAGSDAFISKPVFPGDILPVVDYFLMKNSTKTKYIKAVEL